MKMSAPKGKYGTLIIASVVNVFRRSMFREQKGQFHLQTVDCVMENQLGVVVDTIVLKPVDN